jgi:lysine 6-dehydrogenase
MKIFVLGAGRMGSVVAMDLARSDNGAQIGIGDIDIEKAKSVAKNCGGKALKIDLMKEGDLIRAIKGYDAVVNASWYEFNLRVMKACFRVGCDYNDLGGLFHITQEQLALDKEAKQAGISAIVGGGESPGITNVMARMCAEVLDHTEKVCIYAGAKERPNQKNYAELSFPFSVSTVIDEYSKNPIEFINGKFKEVPPLSGEEKIEFPKPIGLNRVHYSIHSEPATLPFTLGKGVKNVEFKLGVSEAMFNTLRPLIEMGLISEERIPVNGSSITSKDFIVSFFNKTKSAESTESERFVSLRTVVSGSKGRRKRRVKADLVCGPNRRFGINNATAYLTGTAGSIFGQLLAKGKVRDKGVVAPESAVNPSVFLDELMTRGIHVTTQVL